MVLEFRITDYPWQGVPVKEEESSFWGSGNDLFLNLAGDYTGAFTL